MGEILGDDSRSRLVFLWNVVVPNGRRDGCTGFGSNIIEGARGGDVDLRFAQLRVVEEKGGFGSRFLLEGHSRRLERVGGGGFGRHRDRVDFAAEAEKVLDLLFARLVRDALDVNGGRHFDGWTVVEYGLVWTGV